MPGPDMTEMFRLMSRIRHVEQASADLWQRGLISGELHAGAGEEAVAVGVLDHLRHGDAVSVDYRSTPAFVARGVDLTQILLELLGHEDGLCHGHGGHMHLMSREQLIAASGIVGASAPLACGFALAGQYAARQAVTFCFFGDGAVNEGMLMESLNLAVVWQLPAVFVCKDNRWAVTTRSEDVTGGGLKRRARGFGLPVTKVDGSDVAAVWRATERAVRRARSGGGPSFILARTHRLQGHVVGDPLARVNSAAQRIAAELRPLVNAITRRPGAPFPTRLAALVRVTRTIVMAALEQGRPRRDPLARARRQIPAEVAEAIDREVHAEVATAVERAVAKASEVSQGEPEW